MAMTMKKLLFFWIWASGMLLALSLGAQNYNFLSGNAAFGNNFDGSIRPGDRVYVTTGSFQRGLSDNRVC